VMNLASGVFSPKPVAAFLTPALTVKYRGGL